MYHTLLSGTRTDVDGVSADFQFCSFAQEFLYNISENVSTFEPDKLVIWMEGKQGLRMM